jgi:Ser/Thr protein kinase RdoA (MazF antagonist)
MRNVSLLYIKDTIDGSPTKGIVMNKLSPENLFVPSKKNVRGILARYNVPLTRFKHATSGIENLTLMVWSERKKYVLRVYPQKKKSDADILLELDFMSHLRNNGLPLPAIISSSDNQPFVVYEFGNKKWQCVLMEHAQGAHPTAYTPAVLDHMATLQAKMHTLGEQYAQTHNIPSGRSALREASVTDGLLKNSAGNSYFRDFLKRVNAFVVELHDSLPKGLSHFDYDIDNVLTKNGRVTAILDFGDMECMPLVVCLGYTLWDVLFEKGGSAALVARYLQIYQGVRQLNQSEQDVLLQIILFRHYVITTVQIHFGNFNQNDLDKAIQQEEYLRNNVELKF